MVLLWLADLKLSVHMKSLILINFLMVTFGRGDKWEREKEREWERNSDQKDIDSISPFFWSQLEPILKDKARLLQQRRNRILAVPSIRDSYPKVTLLCTLVEDTLV